LIKTTMVFAAVHFDRKWHQSDITHRLLDVRYWA